MWFVLMYSEAAACPRFLTIARYFAGTVNADIDPGTKNG